MLRKRLVSSIASTLEGSSKIAKPAISSLASVNGPSVTVTLLSDTLTRAPFALFCRPSVASRTPLYASSPINFPIAAICSAVGGTPVSMSLKLAGL